MSERDHLGAPTDHQPLAVESGTIGWKSDTDETYFDKGTQENGNVTFIRVTLHRGRLPTEPLTPEVAQGHEIVASLSTPAMGIPARNSKCTVIFPGGFSRAVGTGVIVATQGDPRDAMNSAFIRTSDDGKVTLMTTDRSDNKHAIYLALDPDDGLVFVSPWGKLRFGPNGFHLFDRSGARIDLGAVGGLPSPLSAIASYAALSAGMTHIEGTLVALGTQAGVGMPVAKATSLMTFLGVLVATMNEAAIFAGTLTPGPGTAAEAPTYAAALTAMNDALTAAQAAVPSASTQAT